MNLRPLGTLLFLLLTQVSPAVAEKPNVLFIAIDDLRNDLGALGVAHAKTPQLDRIARTSRVFSHHYVQVPTCGASRAALLRGRYPDAPVFLGNDAIKASSADWAGESLPGWFKQQGYRTYALGKITHYPGGMTGENWDAPPEEISGVWDRAWLPDSPWEHAQAMMHAYANGKPRERGVSLPWDAFDGPDKAYPDAWVAEEAVAHLAELKDTDGPWFFAVGFFKPHLPLAAPKAWHDLHADTTFPAPPVGEDAQLSPGWHPSNELRRTYADGGREVLEDEAYAEELRAAYAASTSYVDHQFGLVMNALEASGMADDTIVVVWSDHGFQLGEHNMWAKHTLFEQALRSPLMIRHPGLKNPGKTSAAIVETVDVFPTLLELCDLPQPDAPLDGQSLVPHLHDEDQPTAKPSLGYWSTNRSVRDDRWRLIVYPATDERPEPAVELFDMIADPFELTNVAREHPDVVERLRAALRPTARDLGDSPTAGGGGSAGIQRASESAD